MFPTECLVVLYDAGETTSMMPVLKQMEEKGQDFYVIVMATAATLVTPDMFKGKRVELLDLGIEESITQATPRETKLSQESLEKLAKVFDPKVVLVGTASRIQKQALKVFSNSQKVAFADNFHYDLSQGSGKTVKKVVSSANHIFCPSFNLVDLFKNRIRPLEGRTFTVVGKPSLELWAEKIKLVDRKKVLSTLKFNENQPIVTIIGGYGPGYEIVEPLYEKCIAKLKAEGYQVIYQPHPKIAKPLVETTEALAVSNFVVGFNSSVLFDSLIIGLKPLYLIPSGTSYDHFAITQGYAPKVTDENELVAKMKALSSITENKNFYNELKIPEKSIDFIIKKINQLTSDNLKK